MRLDFLWILNLRECAGMHVNRRDTPPCWTQILLHPQGESLIRSQRQALRRDDC